MGEGIPWDNAVLVIQYYRIDLVIPTKAIKTKMSSKRRIPQLWIVLKLKLGYLQTSTWGLPRLVQLPLHKFDRELTV